MIASHDFSGCAMALGTCVQFGMLGYSKMGIACRWGLGVWILLPAASVTTSAIASSNSFLSSSRKLRRLSSFSTSKRKKKKRSSRNQRKHTNVYQSPHTENDSISSTASSLFILDESSISQSSINCVNIVGIDKSFNLHSDPYVVQCDEEEDLQNTTVDFSEVDIDIVLL